MKALLIALAATTSQPDLKTQQLVGWRTCLIEEVEHHAHSDQPWEVIWNAARSACREWKLKYWLVTAESYSSLQGLGAFAKAAKDAQDMEALLEGDASNRYFYVR